MIVVICTLVIIPKIYTVTGSHPHLIPYFIICTTEVYELFPILITIMTFICNKKEALGIRELRY
jgi:membrane protein CcdC involved in cytochrome C biogenesis